MSCGNGKHGQRMGGSKGKRERRENIFSGWENIDAGCIAVLRGYRRTPEGGTAS